MQLEVYRSGLRIATWSRGESRVGSRKAPRLCILYRRCSSVFEIAFSQPFAPQQAAVHFTRPHLTIPTAILASLHPLA